MKIKLIVFNFLKKIVSFYRQLINYNCFNRIYGLAPLNNKNEIDWNFE